EFPDYNRRMTAPRTVTVTQLPNMPDELAAAWPALVAHVREQRSDLVLLPEMIFAPWLAASPAVDPAQWQEAMHRHDAWLGQLEALAPAVVLGTRPVLGDDGLPYNEGFLWDVDSGAQAGHRKRFLPDEPGFWE